MATARSLFVLVPVLALGSIGGAAAQTQDEQQACTNDAFQFCQMAIPDRNRVFQCLVDNRSSLSPACHSVMAQYLPADPVPVRATKTKKPAAPAAKDPTKDTTKGTTKTTTAARGGPLNITPP